jgi:hypothetical protein
VRCIGHAACIKEIRNEYNILVGKSEEKRLDGTCEHTEEENG